MQDLTQLTPEQLQQLSTDVLAEQGRRNDLADIPNTVKNLADTYEGLGGNKDDLVVKITEPAQIVEPAADEAIGGIA